MKKKKNVYLILIGLSLLVILLGMKPGYLFGSTTDWLNQHTVFPEYFRSLFYETKSFLPSFAFHLGAGQNIFHFSYYGLLNPIVLISYLLPNVSMATYLQIANIILILLSVLLCYYWLHKRGGDKKLCFLGSCLFLCATPLIYQAHRHFMFVDYMPFLFLGLLGMDRYVEKGYRSLLIIGIFLMILTSYYYSIGGLFVLAIYYIYRYLELHQFSFLSFLKDGICFLYPYLLGILLSGVLLLPTLYVVLHGRSDPGSTTSLLALLLPKIDLKTVLYDGYGMGLTVISAIALIYSLFSFKKERRFLGISCLIVSVIPIFMYLLNGTLYVRSKVLIPFIPLFILLTTFFLQEAKTKKASVFWFSSFPLLLIAGLPPYFLFSSDKMLAIPFTIDLIVTVLCFHFYQKQAKEVWLVGVVALAILFNIFLNQTESYVSIQKYQQINDPKYQETVEELHKQDPEVYRMKQLEWNLPILNKVYHPSFYQTSLYSSTQNAYYHDFFQNYLGNAISNRNNLMNSSTPNLLFDTYMGIRYVFGEEPSLGYEEVEGLKTTVYENKDAFPVIYARSDLLAKEVFDQIAYPYQTDLLLRNVIVDHNIETKATSNIKRQDLTYQVTSKDHLSVKKTKEGYHLEVKEKVSFEIEIEEDLTNQILFLNFLVSNDVSCKQGDRFITINGKTNKITCQDWLYANQNHDFQYVIAEKGDNRHLSITIDKGVYEIKNIETYLLDYQEIEKLHANIDPFIFDQDQTKGDVIKGSIDVSKDGYFVTTIPYDPGFTILVDGKKTEYERINEAFLGFPITAGHHEVEMIYQSPWLKEGKIMSGIGTILFLVTLGLDGYRYCQKKKIMVK